MPTGPALTHKLGVELIHTGVWPISTGVWTATPEALASAVEATTCPAIRPAVLKLGHRDARFDGDPALGWVQNLRIVNGGETLVGDFTGMPAALDQIMASAYPDRSVEGRYDVRCAAGHLHPFVLTAVALLGVTPPGIATLKSFRDVASMYGLAASAPATHGGTAVSVTIRASATEKPLAIVLASKPTRSTSTMTNSALDRPPRPGEDSLDWCLRTGRVDSSTFELIRGAGTAGRVMATAPSESRPAPLPEPKVSGPAYARNPLVDEVLATSRAVYQHSLTAGPPPTLFSAGDVPAETRSGIDPAKLLTAPWAARHAIAAAQSQAEAAELFELVSGPDGEENARAFDLHRHQGNRDYKMRVDSWVKEGVKVEAAAHRRNHEQQIMASSGSPDLTVDEQVEALMAADERRYADRERVKLQAILEGRAVGHSRDLNEVRAAAAALEEFHPAAAPISRQPNSTSKAVDWETILNAGDEQ